VKKKEIVSLVFLILFLIVLQAFLGTFELRPGRNISFGIREVENFSPGEVNNYVDIGGLLMRISVIAFFIVIPIGLFFKKTRKQFLSSLIAGAILMSSYLIILVITPRARETEELVEDETPQFFSSGGEFTPDFEQVEEFEPAESDTNPVWGLVIGSVLTVLLSAGMIVIYSRVKTRKSGSASEAFLDTAREVDEGASIEESIIRLYGRLEKILAKDWGYRRQMTWTVRDFQNLLLSDGFPKEPVALILSLFERVRYGGGELDDSERSSAKQAFSDVIAFLEARR
jgi:hypothetical protein